MNLQKLSLKYRKGLHQNKGSVEQHKMKSFDSGHGRMSFVNIL